MDAVLFIAATYSKCRVGNEMISIADYYTYM